MTLMDTMVKSIKKEKRKAMMINMMPLMMEGIDMNDLMPKMTANMLKDLSTDDIVDFLKDLLNDSDKLSNLATKIAEANLMPKMMMKSWKSKFDFDETVKALAENAPKNGWHIPEIRDLQKLWKEQGIEDAPKIKVLYFCDAKGGYAITKNDELKVMSVMMPMGVSIYETTAGEVEIAAMNISMMSGMFSGVAKETLSNSGNNLDNCLEDIIK
jgi:uncharacterized protein (DUF302 family)